MYRIIGGDGREYGPVSIEQLRQWIVEGRANALSQVRAEGATGWQSLGSVPELASLFSVEPALTSAAVAGSTISAVHHGDYELDIFSCISRGWAILAANFWLLVGGVAIYLLIIGGLSVFAQIPFIGLLFSMLSLLITGPLLGGVYILAFRVRRNQRAQVGDVFRGFRDHLGQLILGHLIPALIAGASAIPGAVLAAIPTVSMIEDKEVHGGLIAVAAAGILLMFIPLIYLSVCWAFTIPLIVERKLDFWPAMKASRAQVSRHWWTVFGLFMVMGILNVIGVFACCIGLFVSMPLVFVVMILAYEIVFVPRTTQPGTSA